MQVLISPHRYFDRTLSIPYTYGIVAVFLNGGFTALTTISIGIIALSQGRTVEGDILHIGLLVFATSFLLWGVVTAMFYIVGWVSGIRTLSLGTLAGMVGLGFLPLAIGSGIELGVTVYYLMEDVDQFVTAGVGTHHILSGVFGIVPVLGIALVHVGSMLWTAYLWAVGSQYVASLTRFEGMIFASIGALLAMAELLVLIWL